MTDELYNSMLVYALNVELGDLLDIKRGRPSLFYGGFRNQHGRPPTDEEIQKEIDRVSQEREEAMKRIQ